MSELVEQIWTRPQMQPSSNAILHTTRTQSQHLRPLEALPRAPLPWSREEPPPMRRRSRPLHPPPSPAAAFPLLSPLEQHSRRGRDLKPRACLRAGKHTHVGMHDASTVRTNGHAME